MEIIIRAAKLLRRGDLVDIGISGGVIQAVAPRLEVRAARELDAAGRLVLPAFVNPHIHLDKCMLGDLRPNRSGTFDEAIENTLHFRERYTVEEIVSRAAPVVELAARYGTTVLRTFADVGTVGGLVPVRALLQLKAQYADLMDIQVVAFPQEGIVRNPGTDALLEEAMRLGADVAGGLPWFEMCDADAREHIDIVFELASAHGKDIHMLVDDCDDPNSRTLEMLAVKVLKSRFPGRVTVSHGEAMASYNNAYADRVLRLVHAAGIHFSVNPHINLMLNGRYDTEPKRRGIARVREMLALGINVCSGQDDVNDLYYPFGRMDQLEVALFMGHAIQTQTLEEIAMLLDFITVNPARALGITNYGLAQGNRADLVVVDAATPKDALRFMAERLWVLRRGRIIAESGTIVRQ